MDGSVVISEEFWSQVMIWQDGVLLLFAYEYLYHTFG